ncbi:MAG TPA: ABC transporter permease [bacterium]|nr:MAG: Glutathione transport system permease protein GsiD [bacterium ADurb.Bin270]HPW44816.1 ABC transporter permease [bacterium]HQC50841.1 ABC transporter permease [bacterium]
MRHSSLKKKSAVIFQGFSPRAAIFAIAFLAALAMFAPIIAGDRPIAMYCDGEVFFPTFSDSISDEKIDELKSKGAWLVMPPIPYSPSSFDFEAVLSPPSKRHILGTDGDGVDVASKLVWGARVSMSVGIVAVGIAIALGCIFGAIAGYFGGIVDWAVSRLIEAVMCFPAFFLILTILAFVGPSIYNIMIAVGLTGWTQVARLVRAEGMRIRELPFIDAARASGASDLRIMLRHLLPHTLRPVIVSASFAMGGAILAEAALSFLGFGVPPSVASWGSMLSDAQRYSGFGWWLTLAPGSAIFIAVMAYHSIGERISESGGRDA